jgi:hypothetical protein
MNTHDLHSFLQMVGGGFVAVGFCLFSLGQSVEVRYDPASPQNAQIASPGATGFVSIGFMAIGVLFGLGGLAVFVLRSRMS